MKSSRTTWGVENDSDDEVDDLKTSIVSIGSNYHIDSRFILAIVMQESTGCVRVPSTFGSHLNPGLIQSFEGTGSCNTNNATVLSADVDQMLVTTTCPRSEIYRQIQDGTDGTGPGQHGLVQNLQQGRLNGSYSGSIAYYRVARLYNSSSIAPSNNLGVAGTTTSIYVSEIANRLMGWAHDPIT